MHRERMLGTYRAAQRYAYDLMHLAENRYRVANRLTLAEYQVSIGRIGEDRCSCDGFAKGAQACRHIEHLRLRLGLPSPSVAQSEVELGIYAWFDRSTFPARIRLGCIGECHATAREAVEGLVTIEDAATLDKVRRKVERSGIPFQVLPSVQLALRPPLGLETDSCLADRIIRDGRPVLARMLPQLKAFQVEGALFLASTQRALLLDEMGLGKTLQAIGAVLTLNAFAPLSSCLVVAPKSVLSHWAAELRRWADLPCTVVTGTAAARRKLYGARTLFKLVTIESLRNDFPNIGEHDLVIVDEVQKVRDVSTLSHRVISHIDCRYFFGLSGTAIEKGLADLYGVLRAGRIPSLESPLEFAASHLVCDDFGGVVQTVAPEAFFIRHANHILRRLKSEVAPSLPNMHITEVDLPLTPLQAELATPMLEELGELSRRLRERHEINDFARKRWLINRLVELSDSSALVAPGTSASSKLVWLATYLERVCVQQRQKVVVFTRWTRSQDLIVSLCRDLGIAYATIRGDHTAETRESAIQRFRTSSDVLAFISTDAGGVGVNLQFARHILLFEPSWNPSVDAQRLQRVHRIGQTKAVEAVFLLTELDWEFVRATHGKKSAPADSIDEIRSPVTLVTRPAWDEYLAVVEYFRRFAQQPDSAPKPSRSDEPEPSALGQKSQPVTLPPEADAGVVPLQNSDAPSVTGAMSGTEKEDGSGNERSWRRLLRGLRLG